MAIPSAAQSTQGILLLADISGYTHFSRLHYTSLLHAEEIITELMESILQSAEFPLQVAQLEGDAVLLYAESPQGREIDAAREAARQVQQFFSAFNLRERSLIACDAGCACQACNQIGELRLKAVLHYGNFTRRELRGKIELLGDDVNMIHALLKAPLEEREHILLTQKFFELSGGLTDQPIHEKRELQVGDEIYPVHVYLPRIELNPISMPKGSGPAFSARLNKYSFARMLLSKPRVAFKNLPTGGMNLFLYLMEGLNSPVNIIRKNIQRAMNRGDLIVRPCILMMVEVKPATEAGRVIANELLQATVSAARPPVVLNKFEGDAALLYALAENDHTILAQSLVNQTRRMYSAFIYQRGRAIDANPDVVKELRAVRFRAILHFGNIAFKKIRGFDELAGLDVILTHRLLQRSSSTESSLWMTDSFHKLVADSSVQAAPSTVMSMEELGNITLRTLSF